MRCLILLNGREADKLDETEKEFYRNQAHSSDIIVCADGGLNIASSLNMEPDMVIGDMDSVMPELLEEIDQKKILRYPADKELTDGKLALEFALNNGCKIIAISCAISNHIDHSLANIQMLSSLPSGIEACITEPDMDVFVVKGPGRRVISGEIGDRVSLLPLSEKATGVTLKGLKYPMRDGEFLIDGMNGISNVMEGKEAEIRVGNGILAIFHYRRPV